MEIYSRCIHLLTNTVCGIYGVRVIDLNNELLEVRDLTTSFRIEDNYYAAVDHVNLKVKKNEVLAIVGESGSGKSAFAFSLMGLHNKAKIEGQILYKGQDIANLPPNQLNKLRGKEMAMIFRTLYPH